MLLSLPMLVVLLSLTLSASTVLGTHSVCSWTGPGNNPGFFQWTYICSGKKVDTDEYGITADYICTWGFDDSESKVADFGQQGAGILEFITPCGKKGWTERCGFRYYGLCIGPRNATTGAYDGRRQPACLFLYAYDDCEWPTYMNYSDKPDKVDIWRAPYPYNPPTASREVAREEVATRN